MNLLINKNIYLIFNLIFSINLIKCQQKIEKEESQLINKNIFLNKLPSVIIDSLNESLTEKEVNEDKIFYRKSRGLKETFQANLQKLREKMKNARG